MSATFYHTEAVDFSKTLDTNILKNQSVIITGGASGIGAGCVKAYAEAGAYVTSVDVNEHDGTAMSNALIEKGYHVQFVEADCASYDAQLSAFKSAISFAPSKSIDIVILSAGLSGHHVERWLSENSSTSSDPTPPIMKTLEVNLMGVHYSTHLALHYFKHCPASDAPARGSSKQIIFISSLAGYLSIANSLDYSAAKFGVRGLFRSIRYSTVLEPDVTLRANLIAPSFVRTAMTADIQEEMTKAGFRFAEVEDAVAGAMRLGCDESIVGRAIAIAGRKEVAGDGNFDIGDDLEGYDGGLELFRQMKDGNLKDLGRAAVNKPGTGGGINIKHRG